MKKTLKSVVAIVMALTMLLSCAFSASASAASVSAAASKSVSVSDIPQIITSVVKFGIAAAKTAYELYDKYVPQEIKDINSTVAEDVTGAVENLVKLDPLKVVIQGKEYDLNTMLGLIGALANAETDKEKSSLLIGYLGCLFTKIIKFIADVIPMPSGMAKLEDYKPESENFYKGTEKFATEAAAGAKWKLGYSQASLVPDDVLNGNYFLAGYLLQNFPSNTVETILDDMKVRTIVLDDGRGKVAFATIDCIGIASEDIKQIRDRVAKQLKDENIISVNIFATHCHSCIDTQGLWNPFFVKLAKNIGVTLTGKGEYSSGTDPKYMEFLFDKTAATIVEACKNMKSGDMYEATIDHLGDDYINDKRGITDVVDNLTRLRFVPDDGSRETFIVNMSAHPYITGLKTDKSSGKELTADYVYYMEEIISGKENDANFMFINGALCGIYSARGVTNDGVDTVRRSEEATRYGHELGRMVVALTMTKDEIKNAGDWLTNDSFYAAAVENINNNAELTAEEKQARLDNISVWYENWAPVKETKVEPILNIRHKEVLVKITNPVIEAVGKVKLVGNKIYYDKDENLYTTTEVGYLEIGKNLKIALLPGEVSPELIDGKGACLGENAYSGADFGYPSLNSMVSDYRGEDVNLYVFGEANDGCGYIVPDNDYSMIFFNGSDLLGDHYQETISFGHTVASDIVVAFGKMMAELKAEK